MKQRIISAIILALIAIPIFLIGGTVFNVTFYVVAILGLREFMKVKTKEKEFPDFIQFIAYIMLTLIYFNNTLKSDLVFYIDYRIVAGLFLVLFIPVILYHNPKEYNIKDAFYLLGGVFFLGSSMSLFYTYRCIGLDLIVYLLLITILTDTFALFTGMLIGKTKLLSDISPNKTWEGSIGGSLIATFVCTVFYITVINPNISLFEITLTTLFLTIIGQFGDLFFSAIKRKFNVKDFSNLIPGHGGVLDRLDSIIFVMLMYTFFIGII